MHKGLVIIYLLVILAFASAHAWAAEGVKAALRGPDVAPPPVGSGTVAPADEGELTVVAVRRHDTPLAPAPRPAEIRLTLEPEEELRRELGSGFTVSRLGDFFLAGDLDSVEIEGRAASTLVLCRDALQRSYFNRGATERIVVYAFRDGESYRGNLERLWHEKPISPYGHYNYVRHHIVFNYETGLGTMVHEMVHALMDPEMPRAPIWFAEGLASLYEQCRLEGRNIRGLVNWRLPELQRKMGTAEYTPLATLFTLDDEAFKGKESLHYAESRYFCMYLESEDVLKRFYRLYRDNFERDPTGRRFVEAVTGEALGKVEEAYLGWVATLRYESAPAVLAQRR